MVYLTVMRIVTQRYVLHLCQYPST